MEGAPPLRVTPLPEWTDDYLTSMMSTKEVGGGEGVFVGDVLGYYVHVISLFAVN